MSATVEQGGTTATYLEAQTILTLAMTEGVGDQVRALRAYAATVYTDLSCRLTTARAATLELLAEKDAVLRAWKANTREILLALGIDAPDGPTLAEAREHMESWLSVETELHAISDVATGARPAEDFIPAEGVLGEVIRALAEKDAALRAVKLALNSPRAWMDRVDAALAALFEVRATEATICEHFGGLGSTVTGKPSPTAEDAFSKGRPRPAGPQGSDAGNVAEPRVRPVVHPVSATRPSDSLHPPEQSTPTPAEKP